MYDIYQYHKLLLCYTVLLILVKMRIEKADFTDLIEE